jgi:hypothetical protein
MERTQGEMGDRSAAHPVERLADAVNGHAGLVRRGERIDVTMLLEYGDTPFLVQIRRGRVDGVTRGPFVMPRWDFALRASAAEWDAHWQRLPAPGHHDLMAMIKRRTLRLEGDTYPFMSNLYYFKAVLASLRPGGSLDSIAPLPVAQSAPEANR